MSKHFLLTPEAQYNKEKATEAVSQQESLLRSVYLKELGERGAALFSEDNLTHVYGRVIVKLDIDNKNSWTFSHGTKIRYERQFNNFNRRQTEPVNCIVISGEGIPNGSEILIHHNAITEQYRIHDYKYDNPNIQYYSIPQEMCFAYWDGDWKPMGTFEFALQVYEPYNGLIQGVEPKIINDTLFVTTGVYKNKVVRTLKASNYIIVFQGKNGQEEQILRFRPEGDGKEREPEAIAIMNELTDKVLSGDLLVGLTSTTAKKYGN